MEENLNIKLATNSNMDVYIRIDDDTEEILKTKGYKFGSLHHEKLFITHNILEEYFEPYGDPSLTVGDDKMFKLKNLFWICKDKPGIILKISMVEFDQYEMAIVKHENTPKVSGVFHRNLNKEDLLFLNSIFTDRPERDNKSRVQLVIEGDMEIEFKEFKLKPKEIDIDLHYNDDFRPVYDHIVEKLNSNSNGIVFLHGLPGTGKTNLIKHLTTVVNKPFIFVPVGMISSLTNPDFLSHLIDNRDSIIIIEDCEKYIEDRAISSGNNSVVSDLLQITDGILSDILEIKIIATFNSDLVNIDRALLRDGRLIAEYEFGELDPEKVLKITGSIPSGTLTLGNVYNTLSLSNKTKSNKNKIGFGS